MEAAKVDLFIMSNSKFFEGHHIHAIRDRLIDMDESHWASISTLQFKDPTMMLIISIIIGSLGVDRFMLGDTTLGVLKLITCGGFGIWTIVDWFLIMGVTREKNMEKLKQYLVH